MTTDPWGNPLSAAAPDAVAGLAAASRKLHLYQADPIAEIDAVLAAHPDFVMGHAFRAGILATACDRAFESEFHRSLAAAEALAPGANPREQGHIAACRAFADGDIEGAAEGWGRVAVAYPRDLVALQLAHLGDFLLGWSHMLRDRVARALPAWGPSDPERGHLLGMQAFGLEESGDYARAEAAGREAVAINRRDGWAVHAVAHCLEMTGRADDGIEWLRETEPGWSEGSMFGYHNWWHLALFHLEHNEYAAVLRLFDEGVASGGFLQAMELVDGAALLWRLHVLGVDVGSRWDAVLDGWRPRAGDAYYAFNDLHAMLAFAATGDRMAECQVLAGAARGAGGRGTNAMMAREVGLPACRGIGAFGRGDYAGCIAALLPIRGKANRFGGSHAQRDVLSWTLTEAAIRSGDAALAAAMVSERIAQKPHSPLNLRWARRASAMTAGGVASPGGTGPCCSPRSPSRSA